MEYGCDFCAHEVDFNKPLAVFKSPSSDVVKVTWEINVFICVSLGGSHVSVMATHWAKVEWSMAVISVHMRLTSTSLLQLSKAGRPML